MSSDTTIRLSEYQPPAYLIDGVSLVFTLDPKATRVRSSIRFRPNPKTTSRDFFLHGENLKLISAKVDGVPVNPALNEEGLTLSVPDAPFLWEAEVEIAPQDNTALEGLYMSKGMYCTQCEAEGFRKITYYPDRPDVMATFDVRIEGDMPVLLSNGNPTDQGKGFAQWHDPWPKPAYLFALVAGDLVSVDDQFTTASGRAVDLKIWVRAGDEDRCSYAMDALKRSMTWDEEVYGREYDLDLFQIVAVDDFNMGAMENKGLNIFNSKYVLASPETATDRDFELIEGIIAHEYFHNWTGNRITCRDWFQLSLKEGLTVFRDQMFSGDQRSHPVKRIAEVQQLRARQFREDAGPLAHPVRPEEYKEINNFYTATVYEKGAEVISMLHGLVGPEAYRKALDLYFERHDGQACTIEDWLQVFEDATGRDLGQFKRWYQQSGTPRVKVEDAFTDGTYTLTFSQTNPATRGQADKYPQVIPIATGLLGPNGDEVVATQMLELTKEKQSFTFEGLGAKPIPSILRNFSAPVILERATTKAEQVFLLAHDTDPFNKWEAGRQLAREILVEMVLKNTKPDPGFLAATHRIGVDETLDPAFRALALGLPSEDDIALAIFEAGTPPDPLAIHKARKSLGRAIAGAFGGDLDTLFQTLQVDGPYDPNATDAGRRALQGAALSLITKRDGRDLAARIYRGADNMTVSLAALSALLADGSGQTEADHFYRKWQGNDLVIDKWFTLSISLAAPDVAVETAESLAAHPDFDWKNPNRFRALMAGFSMINPAGFHRADGAGYRFFADWLIRLDPLNPQTTARMSGAFETWRRYDQTRQTLIRQQLERIADQPKLSRDLNEMISRMLGA